MAPVTSASTLDPIVSRTWRNPILPGLSETSGVVTDEPVRIAATAQRKAALEGSLGTEYSPGGISPGIMRSTDLPTRSPRPRVTSHRSVWSRNPSGDAIVDGASPWIAASANAVRSCAEATGRTASAGRRVTSAPPTVMGAVPLLVSTLPPSAPSGPTSLSIGRLDNDSSPTSTDSNDAALSAPAIRRIVVPEFPQSRTFAGSAHWRTPGDVTDSPSNTTPN